MIKIRYIISIFFFPLGVMAQSEPSPQVTDVDKNGLLTTIYDALEEPKASKITYFNSLGKPVQYQQWDAETQKIWTGLTFYDKNGRAALQTFSAPLGGDSFTYNYNAMLKENTLPYARYDFDTDTDNPIIVGTQVGTLGWYYSENNTSEPYQDITEYPFSRVVYSELNPGSVLKTIGGNKVNGEWPQGYVFSMPASQELSQAVAFGESKYDTIRVIKTVSRDVHGVENVVFTDTDGKTLAAARSGGATFRNMAVSMGEQGYVDIHVPDGTTGFTVNKPSGVQVKVYDLITEEELASATTSLPGGFYRVAVTDAVHYDPDAMPVQVNYKENYYDYALNEYDRAGRLVASYQPYGNTKQAKPKSTFEYDALGQLVYTDSPDEGEARFKYRKDGQIRYSRNSEQEAKGEFSYTGYDHLARPVESGVLVSSGFDNADPDGPLPSGTRKEQQFTVYDTGQSIVVAGNTRVQAFVAGNVARTYNDHTTTWYSYDIYGRVSWMVQEIPGIGKKTIDYEYHPVSGLVSRVVYQKDITAEQFIHRYTYDKTDQLVQVETSVDGNTYKPRASYTYYENGSLKRTELGDNLQGIDYVYNLSGQLKSINHPALGASEDPGGDSNDVFGMVLDYHQDDYRRNAVHITPAGYGQDRLDGNIKGIRWNNDYQPLPGGVHTYSYAYNRNNWLSEARYGDFGSGFVANPQEDYKVSITYDANGNIQTLDRNKNTTGSSNAMDQLTYTYASGSPNRLDHIDDAVTAATGADDIKGQATGNYIYNTIGQLTENQEENVKYRYTASGLVSEVLKNNVPLVKFFYNDRGHRVKKESYTSGSLAKTEYYVRDASGSVMAIYQGTMVKEYPIYGGSRLGVYFKSGNTAVYQLTDHLGNVRALIEENGTLAGATDYYPFGMAMPGRSLQNAEGYRYTYQGQEKDPETGKEAFQLRLWDSRIGRWLTTDPYGQFHSPYLGMGNDPVNGIDPDGGYKSKWARFWGWVGGGFKGSFVNNENASNPYKTYGIQTTEVDADGGITGTVSFGDWKADAAADIMSGIRQQEFQNTYTTTYDTRLEAIASAFQLALPNAPNIRVPGINVFSKTPDEVLLNSLPKTINEAGQARHIVGFGLKTPVKQNSASSLLTESAEKLLKTVHSQGYKTIERINDSKIRVVFDEIIGLHRTQSGTLGTPTNTAILHYGKKGVHFVPTINR